MSTHLLRFVLFNGAGVCLLFGYPDDRKHIEDRLALDFQLSGQVVNSNLAHPPFPLPDCPAKSSYQPHGRVRHLLARDPYADVEKD